MLQKCINCGKKYEKGKGINFFCSKRCLFYQRYLSELSYVDSHLQRRNSRSPEHSKLLSYKKNLNKVLLDNRYDMRTDFSAPIQYNKRKYKPRRRWWEM